MPQHLQIINVGNGSSDYPGNFTKKEIEIIKQYTSNKKTLHLFSGKSTIGDIRVDFSQHEATINKDVFEFLDDFNEKVDCIVLDPPYNQKFANKYQKIGDTPKQFIIFASTKKTTNLFNKIILLNPEYIIIKSWNYYVPKHYKFHEGYLCYAGGYRKPTVLMICKRKKQTRKITVFDFL